MLGTLGWGEIPAQKVLCGRDTKGAAERQVWQKQHVGLWAERCVGRVVYSLEGEGKEYEFHVDFQSNILRLLQLFG